MRESYVEGGGLIRDGIFLQVVPAAVQNWRCLAAVALAVLIAVAIGDKIEKRLTYVILIADALGLGLYAVVGSQKSINLGLTVYAARRRPCRLVRGNLLRGVTRRQTPVPPDRWFRASRS